MPQVQQDWGTIVGNSLIAKHTISYEQQKEMAQLEADCMTTFNLDQQQAFDQIVQAVNTQSGQTFFLHGPGDTDKTYVYNTLYYYLCGQSNIVLCIASSGI